MLWTLHELQKALSLNTEGENIPVTGINIDTRTIQKGDMFVALQAERDGHDFVDTAMKKGASCCLVSKKMDSNIPQLIVSDTLEALTTLAKNRITNHTGKRIAVTGSSGKTSLTHMLATVCEAHKPEKSYNNHWGVPLTLARMPKNSDVAVIEIGTNHVGEIAPLVKLAKPNVAVITNIAHAHIGNFENLEALADEKISIQQGLSDDGILILPEETKNKWQNKITAKTLTFGLTKTADIHLIEKIDNKLTVNTPNGDVSLILDMIGEHHILNAMATIAVLYALKMPIEFLQNMNKVSALAGRGKIHKLKDITFIDDSYNANPLSMKMALETLQNYPSKGRKIAILGDMLELGEDSSKYHANLFSYLSGVDGVVTVGENMIFLDERLPESMRLGHYETVQDLGITKITSLLKKEDVILLKGSNGIFWIHDFAGKLSKELL
jgi:UDP-N-acetylmuramoyl-tripeptide--D-alanyl-D-alanine ligase